MNFLTISYLKQPDGSWNELLSVRKNLRVRDYTNCSIILDFKNQKVIKASVEGRTVNQDFASILEFYYQFHSATIKSLLQFHGYQIEDKE
jgi:hypothetical protein